MFLLQKRLPPLPPCHMEKVLFSFYHLKLIKSSQARDASLGKKSPFFAAGYETAISLSLQDINREDLRNIL